MAICVLERILGICGKADVSVVWDKEVVAGCARKMLEEIKTR